MQTDPLQQPPDLDKSGEQKPTLRIVTRSSERLHKRLRSNDDGVHGTFDLKLALLLSVGLWTVFIVASYFLAIVVL